MRAIFEMVRLIKCAPPTRSQEFEPAILSDFFNHIRTSERILTTGQHIRSLEPRVKDVESKTKELSDKWMDVEKTIFKVIEL